MKKTSRIFLRVGSIVSIVTSSILVLLGIMFIVFALPFFQDIIREGIESGAITTDAKTVDIAVMIWTSSCISTAVTMLIFAALGFVNMIFGFKSLSNPTKKGFILNIVFGFISGVEFTAVGGILGLINRNREARREAK